MNRLKINIMENFYFGLMPFWFCSVLCWFVCVFLFEKADTLASKINTNSAT